ncbi:MAG: virulence RhuM family protein [Parabacteroides sp.]|nr:virulence RhuM family protein [Parabacteroides sp.]
MGNESENFRAGELLIYQTEDGSTKIDVFFQDDTIWLNQKQISQLYQKGVNTINEHIKHIFEDDELEEKATIRKFRIVQMEGSREVARDVEYYNLNMILAIGYRVRSHVGNQFRRWASEILTEYMKKGFAMNDERLKNPKKYGADYFDELLERIRDIRASEKRFYQKIKDIYTLSVDYDPNTNLTKGFFASVQNKLHYSVHGHTAAELISERADAAKENMGLTNFAGNRIRKGDVTVAKNYLSKEELEDLNRMVTMFLDHAEDMARQNILMYMKDWAETLNDFLKFRRRDILTNAGKISKDFADRKAVEQYELYSRRQLKKADEEPFQEIDELEKLE